MTGSQYADLVAQQAVADFIYYLESLPIETQVSLLALKGQDRTLEQVKNHLTKGYCVETAASNLQAIIDNPQNATILNQHPTLDESFIRRIKQGYEKTPLTIRADDTTAKLPPVLLQGCLDRIHIQHAYDYISLLLSFPPDLYSPLMQYAHLHSGLVLPPALAEEINEGIFSEEQKQAFFEALATHYKRFGVMNILEFSRQTRTLDAMLIAILKNIPIDERPTAIKENNAHGESMLHYAISSPDALRTILESLTDDESRLEALEYCTDTNVGPALCSAVLNLEG